MDWWALAHSGAIAGTQDRDNVSATAVTRNGFAPVGTVIDPEAGDVWRRLLASGSGPQEPRRQGCVIGENAVAAGAAEAH